MSKRRICIIGNSHAASISSGLELMPELSEKFSFDFFAAHSNFMQEMELRGPVIAPTSESTRQRWKVSSRGKTEIDTSNYTNFLIVGLGFNALTAIYALRKYRLYGFHSDSDKAATFLSHACFEAMMRSTLNSSPAMYFARLLGGVSNAQVTLIPHPYPSEEIINGGHEYSDFWKFGIDNGMLSHATRLYRDVAKQVTSEVGCGLMFQPSSTVVQDLFTQFKFSLNSNMSNEQSSDPYHMNKLFGAEMLKSYCEHFQQ